MPSCFRSQLVFGSITTKTAEDLKGFLSFRHFVRHAYSFEIAPKAIDVILDAAPRTGESVHGGD